MEYVYGLISGLLGLAVGSFLNVVISRLPLQIVHPNTPLNVCCPPSHCHQCTTALRWRDNIPLISWLLLRGKCRYCHCKISGRYPQVEIITALLTLLLIWLMPVNMQLLGALILFWALTVLAFIDLEHLLLPDVITLPLLWIALLFKAMGWLPGSLQEAVWGSIAGYCLLWALSILYQWIRGIEGLGMGDAKLLAAIGAWLGWSLLPWVLLLASGGAILCVLISRVSGQRELNYVIAFGPWIALAAISLFIHSIIF
ncbi:MULTISPECIES: prepilin peptidase [unclassified Pantoea]|jgi:general secretion pathway protein O/leader peptidase (prepilin peptidase)/N-methyltransferase|uniref:prepilin peptidase n=2 Tax=Pantoea TaxID=53335 RepID=UPI00177FA863|nr:MULTISPECIES: A24 family peptidase [unclassified Pantoea]MBD9644488.1 prepilin peptidase [Pantoea sp. PNT02]MDR6353116.1 general secretion pathway protein O [Pantoea sp. SORGH_AS_0659]